MKPQLTKIRKNRIRVFSKNHRMTSGMTNKSPRVIFQATKDLNPNKPNSGFFLKTTVWHRGWQIRVPRSYPKATMTQISKNRIRFFLQNSAYDVGDEKYESRGDFRSSEWSICEKITNSVRFFSPLFLSTLFTASLTVLGCTHGLSPVYYFLDFISHFMTGIFSAH